MGSIADIFRQFFAAQAGGFDAEGDGYDYESARAAGLGPDAGGHWPSRDPRTGVLLKGRQHPTWDLLEQGEREAGNEIFRRGGRYVSMPGRYEQRMQPVQGRGGPILSGSGAPVMSRFGAAAPVESRTMVDAPIAQAAMQLLQQQAAVPEEPEVRALPAMPDVMGVPLDDTDVIVRGLPELFEPDGIVVEPLPPYASHPFTAVRADRKPRPRQPVHEGIYTGFVRG